MRQCVVRRLLFALLISTHTHTVSQLFNRYSPSCSVHFIFIVYCFEGSQLFSYSNNLLRIYFHRLNQYNIGKNEQNRK